MVFLMLPYCRVADALHLLLFVRKVSSSVVRQSGQPATGLPALSSPLSYTTTTPTVTIAGIPAKVLFSGLEPGNVGLYQVNAQIPSGITPGLAVVVV